MDRGFSLVELSIVLVILGLLTGGILTGQSLIRASELRSVTVDFQRYQTAYQTFRDKYFSSPGDMRNATSLWGTDVSCAGAYAGTTPAAGTCNGNGDGVLNLGTAANTNSESMQFWKQLALAGLIEGSYTGFTGSGGIYTGVIGQNVPATKMSNGGWGIQGGGIVASYAFVTNYGNFMIVGTQDPNGIPQKPLLKPEEAWNIDTKLDDGKPATGGALAYADPPCVNYTSNTDYAATYNLTNTGIACQLIFPRRF